ncbi:MAG: response regulator transcription factor [Candidatus Pacebacteria bacterium]|nr:response regulator transcription factor [Candidatus Paceibacterota bacterium]
MKKILVIDDMLSIVSEIKQVFDKKKGFEVIGPDSVNSYSEAIELINEHGPDIIALDMSLTDGGNKEGVDIASDLYGISYKGLIVVISNYDIEDLMNWVGKYGISHYAGGKDAEKFSECVLGKCQCQYWAEYLKVQKTCDARNWKLNRKKIREKILVSMGKRSLAIATVKQLLKKAGDREDLLIEIINEPGALRYSIDLDKKIRIISDSDHVNIEALKLTDRKQISALTL